MAKDIITFIVNGKEQKFILNHDIRPNDTLAYVLREKLGLTSAKVECNEGVCGACTVNMDDKAILSCMTLAVECDGHEILTLEGLDDNHPLIKCFALQHEPCEGTALQCGICTPGFIMTARAFLLENPDPTEEEIKEALAGNVCRCGAYTGIIKAVKKAAAMLREQQ